MIGALPNILRTELSVCKRLDPRALRGSYERLQLDCAHRPPDRNDNRAAQEAADNDNFRSATARVCNNDTMADIGANNIATVHGLYHPPVAPIGHPTPPPTAQQRHHLPGDICASIRSGAKNRGSGANADSIDAFIDLVSLNISEVNSDIRQLFDLV